MKKGILSILLAIAMVFSSVTPLAAQMLPAESTVQNVGVLAGLYGFEEAGISLYDSETVSVIVVLKNNPAPVAKAIIEAGGDVVSYSAEMDMVDAAANDKTIFHAGLEQLFTGSGNGIMSAQSADDVGFEIVYDYDTAVNGVLMTLPANKVDELLTIESVAAVFYNEEIMLPEIDIEELLGDADGSDVLGGTTLSGARNTVAFLALEMPEAHAKGYRGAGTIIGVMDTGVDYHHPDLKPAFFWYANKEDAPARWQERLTYVPDGSQDGMPGMNWVYYGVNGYDTQFEPFTNTQHPFPKFANGAYNPLEITWFDWYESGYPLTGSGGTSMANNHGTHVSGTMVARGTSAISQHAVGVAPEANLIAYRIGGPGGSGNQGGVLMCIEEAIKDGVDVLNYSFGSSFNPGPYTPLSLALNNAALTYNMVFSHSAGNSGSTYYSMGGPQSSMQIDSGSNTYNGINAVFSVGSTTYDGNLVYLDVATGYVPAIDPLTNKVKAFHLVGGPNVNENTVNEDDSLNFFFMPQRPFGSGFQGIGTGSAADWNALTPDQLEMAKGKVVIVARGSDTLTAIPTQAKNFGASAVLIINTETGTQVTTNFGTSVSTTNQNDAYVPMFTMTYSDGIAFAKALLDNELQGFLSDLNGDNRGSLTSSSSRGPVQQTFEIKPTIVTPGNAIMSTIPWYQGLATNGTVTPAQIAARDRSLANYAANGYASMGGTSMASPHTAGLVALIIGQDLAEKGATNNPGLGPNPAKMKTSEAIARLANTANRDWWTNKNFSVHEVGSGSPHISKAIEAESYITVNKPDVPVPATDIYMERNWMHVTGEVSAFSFGGANIGIGDVKQLIANIYNTSNVEKTYNISYELNTTQNQSIQNVKSNGKVVPSFNVNSIRVAANSMRTFTTFLAIPSTLTTEDIGSHEGYINITNAADSSETYHLPWAVTIQNELPQWYIDGEVTGAYNISTGAQLEQLANIVNGQYGFVDSFAGKVINLTSDVDVSAFNVSNPLRPGGWYAIGTFERPFEGTFNGNTHAVRGLTSQTGSTITYWSFKALFGHVRNATIRDLTVYSVNNTNWTVAQYSAGIAGFVTTDPGKTTLIENCVNEMNIVCDSLQAWSMMIGGIVGAAETHPDGTLIIKDCINNGDITGSSFLGGILGGTVVNPANVKDPTIPGSGGAIGSIIGDSSGTITISNNINNGAIRGVVDLSRSGGIVGYFAHDGLGSAEVENCVNNGHVYLNNSLTAPGLTTIFPGYGNYSPEREWFNAVGGIIGHAINVDVKDVVNNAVVDNAQPFLAERAGSHALPEGATIKGFTGGIVGLTDGGSIVDSFNGGNVNVLEIVTPATAPSVFTLKGIVGKALDTVLAGNFRSVEATANGLPFELNDAESVDGAIFGVPSTYNVVFLVDGSVYFELNEVADGSLIIAPEIPVKDGYSFVNWFTTPDFAVAWDFDLDTVTADISLYALFEEITSVTPAQYEEYVNNVELWNNIYAWATGGNAPFATIPNIYTQQSILAANAILNSVGGEIGGAHAQAIRDDNGGQAGPPYWLEKGHSEILYWCHAVKDVVEQAKAVLVVKAEVMITDEQFAEYVSQVKLWNNLYAWASGSTATFADVTNIYTVESIQAAVTVLNNAGGEVGGAHAQAIRDANGGQAGPPYWLEKDHADMLNWYQAVKGVVDQAVAVLVEVA